MKRKGPRRNFEKQRFWQRAVGQWRRSGQSIRDFCRANALSEPSFYAWRRELTQRRRSPRTAGLPGANGVSASFLPVRVAAAASPMPAADAQCAAVGGVEIVLAAGRTVRVRTGFDRQTLADVLSVLEGRPC
jgi:transposase-like protein